MKTKKRRRHPCCNNPQLQYFSHHEDEDAVRLYEEWLRAQPELMEAVKKELKGKILGCHCYSTIEACHANVLLKIANEE